MSCMPQVASGPALKGVCGYGDMSQTLFPRMNVASVSAVNPGRICGSCIQIRCSQASPPKPLAALHTVTCLHSYVLLTHRLLESGLQWARLLVMLH